MRSILASTVGLASLQIDPGVSTLIIAILNAVAAWFLSRKRKAD